MFLLIILLTSDGEFRLGQASDERIAGLPAQATTGNTTMAWTSMANGATTATDYGVIKISSCKDHVFLQTPYKLRF